MIDGVFKINVTPHFSRIQWKSFQPDPLSSFMRGNFIFRLPEINSLHIASSNMPELAPSTLYIPGESSYNDTVCVSKYDYHQYDINYAINCFKLLKACFPTIQIVDFESEKELTLEDIPMLCQCCSIGYCEEISSANGIDKQYRCVLCERSFSICIECNTPYKANYTKCPKCCAEYECAYCNKVDTGKYVMENSTGNDIFLCKECSNKDILFSPKLRYDFKTTFTYRRFLNESTINALSNKKRISKSPSGRIRDTENTPTQQQVQPSTTRCDSELGQQVRVPLWNFITSDMRGIDPCAESPVSSEPCEQQAEVPTVSTTEWAQQYQFDLDRYFEQFYPTAVATGRPSSVLPDEGSGQRRRRNSSSTVRGTAS